MSKKMRLKIRDAWPTWKNFWKLVSVFFQLLKHLFTIIHQLFVYISGDKKGVPVVGMIVEPIQSEGGDHHGSNAWFQVC